MSLREPACQILRIACLLSLATSAAGSEPQQATQSIDRTPAQLQSQPPQLLGELDFALLPEASGMSASRRIDGRLWFVNDQGNGNDLIAVDLPAMRHEQVAVDGVKNRDWEDLAGFELDDTAWLMIADVGDNRAARKSVGLVFVREPATSSLPARVDVAGVARLAYPDGARDVESVAIDGPGDQILLLSKRTSPPVLYALGLRATLEHAVNGNSDLLTPQRLGEVNRIPAPTALELRLFPRFGRYRNQPTAMDISADGTQMALLTYGEAYRITRANDETWLDALNRPLTPLGMPVLAQPETIAFDLHGSILLSTEQENAPLLKFSSAQPTP